ncbi:MAG: COX15/CtaA family protein [Pseudomonadota bacterium]
MKKIKILLLLTTVLAYGVVLKGAYTRLVDAGLGCPDWPGCYGYVLPPLTDQQTEIANNLYPERPFEEEKAWPEMIHRYLASLLGFLIMVIAFVCWRKKEEGYPYRIALLLVPLVIFQGVLGMWTVTMGLFPPIVVAHLLGGFLTASLLTLMTLRIFKAIPQWPEAPFSNRNKLPKSMQHLALVALVVVLCQIALGGWTSANYAALACLELPVCHSGWINQLNFTEAFSITTVSSGNYEYGILSENARITIHVLHRMGAILTTMVLIGLAWQLLKQDTLLKKQFRILGSMLLIGLCIQILLGIGNIVLHLPLAIAVAHNGVALSLLVLLLVINLTLRHSMKAYRV